MIEVCKKILSTTLKTRESKNRVILNRGLMLVLKKEELVSSNYHGNIHQGKIGYLSLSYCYQAKKKKKPLNLKLEYRAFYFVQYICLLAYT